MVDGEGAGRFVMNLVFVSLMLWMVLMCVCSCVWICHFFFFFFLCYFFFIFLFFVCCVFFFFCSLVLLFGRSIVSVVFSATHTSRPLSSLLDVVCCVVWAFIVFCCVLPLTEVLR